jgi:hypothetical protein
MTYSFGWVGFLRLRLAGLRMGLPLRHTLPEAIPL